jgi:hypothetical protein
MANAPDIFQGSRFAQQGDRKKLQAMASAGGVRQTASPAAVPYRQAQFQQVGQASGVNMGSPLARLAGMPTDEAPATSGLSLGPGTTPPPPGIVEQQNQLSRAQKLAALAMHARSPHLRVTAAAMIRRIAAEQATQPQVF